MIYYKDKTFCKSYKECAAGDNCPRALRPEVIKAAEAWWGEEGSPIATYSCVPKCFVEKIFTVTFKLVDGGGCDDCILNPEFCSDGFRCGSGHFKYILS